MSLLCSGTVGQATANCVVGPSISMRVERGEACSGSTGRTTNRSVVRWKVLNIDRTVSSTASVLTSPTTTKVMFCGT